MGALDIACDNAATLALCSPYLSQQCTCFWLAKVSDIYTFQEADDTSDGTTSSTTLHFAARIHSALNTLEDFIKATELCQTFFTSKHTLLKVLLQPLESICSSLYISGNTFGMLLIE